MATRAEFIAEARTWIGTPFHHQGRLKGVGTDCAGVLIGTMRACNLSAPDVTGYGRAPFQDELRRHLAPNLIPIHVSDIQPADVLLLRIRREPQHIAIVTEIGILHAYEQSAGCVEHALDALWRARIVAAYCIPGLT